jgi:hypothetical protein
MTGVFLLSRERSDQAIRYKTSVANELFFQLNRDVPIAAGAGIGENMGDAFHF